MSDKDLTKYSSAELQQMRAQIDEDELDAQQKAGLRQLDALIAKKIAEETVAEKERTDLLRKNAGKMDAKAKALFPELKDRESEFSKRVDDYLESMGTATSDPGALLQAAFMVADELGVSPTMGSRAPKEMKVGTSNKEVGADEGSEDFVSKTKHLHDMFSSMGLNLEKDEVRERLNQQADKVREDQ
jgi:hypothetical protein